MIRRLSFILALCTCFLASGSSSFAQLVKAETGGVAIRGNVSSSTINIGVPPEQLAALIRQANDLSESQKKLIANLEAQLDLNQRQIHAALDIVGETNIPSERIADKLIEIAKRFKTLQISASTQPGESPKVAGLKVDAQKAINAGELAKADALLADAEVEQRHDFELRAFDIADTSARRGEIALIRLRYGEAASHFADAAAVLPPSGYEDARIDFLNREASALYRQGDEFADNNALRLAIERYKHLLDLPPACAEFRSATKNIIATLIAKLCEREKETALAATQNNLAAALSALGGRESGTARLEDAIVAYRDALKKMSRDRLPLDWAMTQSNLGAALQTLGERETGTSRLEEAVAAYREALNEMPHERAPLQWAMTQNNLGAALRILGGRESGTTRLEEALAALREALKEMPHERAPLQWAMTQNNLGATLQLLAERESGTARLEEAVVAYRDALKESTRERAPLQWAMIQNNLGSALGARESGTARLEEAVVAYADSLKERTRSRAPLQWAVSFGGQGVALMLLAERTKDAAMAEMALQLIEAALETLSAAEHAPFAAYYNARLVEARRIRDALKP